MNAGQRKKILNRMLSRENKRIENVDRIHPRGMFIRNRPQRFMAGEEPLIVYGPGKEGSQLTAMKGEVRKVIRGDSFGLMRWPFRDRYSLGTKKVDELRRRFDLMQRLADGKAPVVRPTEFREQKNSRGRLSVIWKEPQYSVSAAFLRRSAKNDTEREMIDAMVRETKRKILERANELGISLNENELREENFIYDRKTKRFLATDLQEAENN